MSRPDKSEVIKNNLGKIEEWAAAGLTIKQIAKKLGMSASTFYKYKAESDIATELKDTVKKGRESAVEILENSLFQSAIGHTRKVKKYTKLKNCNYIMGRKDREWEEIVEYEEEEYIKPEAAAAIFLLKNWAHYMNEPKAIKIREKEVEIKERQIEAQNW
jgi:DNA-binding CsgD family transcriptional regulator